VVCDGIEVSEVVPARRDRALLAALAIERRRVWLVDELAEAIWADRAPLHAAKVVRNRVSALRSQLGRGFIVSVASGYRLGPDVIVDADDAFGGSATVWRAVWRGRPFVDVEDWPPAWPVIARLVSARQEYEENALADDLDRSDVVDAVARAEAMVAEEPLRERRWLLLFRALEAGGHVRAALEAVQRARRAMREVGLRLPPDLQAAERDAIDRLAEVPSPAPLRSGREWFHHVTGSSWAVPPGGNLSLSQPGLFGRTDDLAAARRALEEHSLVTLTGVGGVGKTALALALADDIRDRFADGVWIFELAAVSGDSDVAPAMAMTMGLRPEIGRSQQDLIVQALTMQSCLVVLDNCEHVLAEVSAMVGAILLACPSVRVLATSREPLGVIDGHVMAVPALNADAAVALFAARAGRALAEDSESELVDELCGQLDRLPLAIELAASRVGVMTLADLNVRLDLRFRLLRNERGTPQRHQTLQAMVGWSYDLLAPDQRQVFERLSVFAGGFTLAASEVVCAAEPLERSDITVAVVDLAEKSMVHIDPSGRYRQLETVRQFAAEQLNGQDRDWCRRRHALHFAAFARDAHEGLQGGEAGSWWQALQADWANIRTAFRWAIDVEDVDIAVTIATRLLWAATWHDTAEPYEWIETVSQLTGAPAHPDWASVQGGRAWAAWERGDLNTATTLGAAALNHERSGVINLDCYAELALMSAAFFHGRVDDARRYAQRAQQRGRQLGNSTVESVVGLTSQVVLDVSVNDIAAALDHAHSAFRLADGCGNKTAAAWALAWEANALVRAHDTKALAVAQQACTEAESVDARLPLSTAQRALALTHLQQGHPTEAARLVLVPLQTMRRRGAALVVRNYILLALNILVDTDTPAPELARLWGVAHSSTSAGAPDNARFLTNLRAVLEIRIGEEHFDRCASEGRRLPLERAATLTERELTRIAGGNT